MDAVAVLHVTTRLASVNHQGALTTDQFVRLTDKKEGPRSVYENLSEAWKLRCDIVRAAFFSHVFPGT